MQVCPKCHSRDVSDPCWMAAEKGKPERLVYRCISCGYYIETPPHNHQSALSSRGKSIALVLALLPLGLPLGAQPQVEPPWTTSNPPAGQSYLRALASRLGANPGVGYTPSPGFYACWQSGQDSGVYLMDLTARPWGVTGNGPLDSDAFNRRYLGGKERLGGSVPCGMAAELWRPGNESVLVAAYEGSCPLVQVDPVGRDGQPTIEEMTDLSVVSQRCGNTYWSCWKEREEGGTPGTPIHATVQQMEAFGWCDSGVVEAERVLCSWPIWYSVDPPAETPWCEDVEPPQPPPVPGCNPYEGSECEALCRAKGKAREGCFELADRNPGSRLEKLCSGVCRGEEPPPPPPPPPPPARECYRWEPTAVTVERSEFVPGVPSTGRLEVELSVSGEWVEAECAEREVERRCNETAEEP